MEMVGGMHLRPEPSLATIHLFHFFSGIRWRYPIDW
jgi:hypothetical protein